MAQRIEKELHDQIARLRDDEQLRLLEFARSLSAPAKKGAVGQSLLRFAGTIEKSDVMIMNAAIEDACETVHSDDW